MATKNPDEGWFEFIPPEKIPDLLGYISSTWNYLIERYPSEHSYKKREEKLTVSLCNELNNAERRQRSGITGRFIPEAWVFERQHGEMKKIGRTDIMYVYSGPGTPVLIIEFKKLDGSNQNRKRKSYCNDGMQRFIDGKYAQNHPVGIMCGLIKTNRANELKKLENFIKTANNINLEAFYKPSLISPSIDEFDSRHGRTYSARATAISLVHFFLDFKGLSLE
jgi:hypothetical protein